MLFRMIQHLPGNEFMKRPSVLARAAVQIALLSLCVTVAAQDRKPAASLPPMTVKATRDPVEKSFRKMIRGMDLFERLHSMAPSASLRFRLLPRRPHTDMDRIVLEVVGDSFSYQVPVAPDHTFTLERNRKALDEDAVVTTNRRKLSMTWRTDIRTPGLPPGTRRLGDLRLECRVGLEADLVSNTNPVIARISNLFTGTEGYCERKDAKYLFFADRPLFSVALVAGARREILPIDQLYAQASDDPGLKWDLPFCDCEVLVDRTYFVPLGDRSWPDDTLVEFDYMDD
jgi:hypothetical protein